MARFKKGSAAAKRYMASIRPGGRKRKLYKRARPKISMARRRTRRSYSPRRSIRRARRGAKGFMPLVNKAAKGIGYAMIAGAVLSMVAPQYAPIGKLAAAFYGGGLPGVAAQFVIGGGQIPAIGALGIGGPAAVGGATFS